MKKPPLIIAGISAVLFCLQVSSGKQKGIGNFQSLAIVPPQVPRIDANYGKMPLHFIPNEGQVGDPAAFYVQGRDKTIYFAPEGLTFVLRGSRESTSERWVVKLDFVGANPGVIPVSLEESGAVISYFKGKLEDWKTGLPASSKIVYRGLWPGIDLIYYGTVDRMKYEFIVHPGADPSRINLAYRGAESVTLTEEGRLAIATPVGGFKDDVPVAWQEVEGAHANVPVAYALETFVGERKLKPSSLSRGILTAKEASPESRTRIYGFDVGHYDRSLPLVLDPAILVYCGYIGGAGWEKGSGIAVDGLGNAYVTGDTSSTEDTFPLTVGPDLTFNGEPEDAFVAKVNSAGTGLIYCSYIGGSGWEEGKGIAVDGSGNAYVTGETSSTDFPVTSGSGLTYNGDIDAFVAKVNADGTDLIYSGHIGSWNWDTGKGITVDGLGNAYVTGWTFSDDLPVKIGPDLTYNGSQDVFIAKVNTSGTALVYCGYIGGWANEESKGIAVDGSGNAYITGCTYSTNFPTVVGPGRTFKGGSTEAFVAKVKADGTSLAYCGYIGGDVSDRGYGNDCGYGIAVDGSGNAYVTGQTDSTEATLPVTVGPDLTFNGSGDYDGFVAMISPNDFGFILEASPASAMVTAGQSVTYTVQVMRQFGSLDAAVSFSCTGLPKDCTASFSPASVTLGANPATTMLTLKTTARMEATTGGMFAASTPIPPALGFLVLTPAIGFWCRFRRLSPVRLPGRWLAAAALICVIGLTASCSAGGDKGTPAGTYQITIRGESGSVQASTTITLTVE